MGMPIPETYRELLIGCGNSRQKRFAPSIESGDKFRNLTTVDVDPDAKADFTFDLNKTPWPLTKGHSWYDKCPDSIFNEIHAYEVLEHLGQQGDWRGYFAMFSEIYRLLKPGGYLCASCPSMHSRWAWGDPGHTRIISPECLTFLDQTEYTKQIGKTSMTDYRAVWKGDFELTGHKDDGDSFLFILKAHKPIRA